MTNNTAMIEQFVEQYRQKIQNGQFYRKPKENKQDRQPRLIQNRKPQETMPYNSTQTGYADHSNLPDMAFASKINIKNKNS